MRIKSIKAIVTGGCSGIGKACVSELIKHGGSCSVFDKKENKEKEVEGILSNKKFFYKTDVSKQASVQESIDKAINSMKSIHVLINCAGIGFANKIISNNLEDENNYMDNFKKTLQVNLVGSMNMIKFVAKKMLENIPNGDGERGIIINTASIAAFEGQIGQAAYSASKAGIIGMMLPLVREFASYGIRVITISPGFFDTPMFSELPKKIKEALINRINFPKRLANPLEFARLAIHIIENPILNGETIRLDSAIRM